MSLLKTPDQSLSLADFKQLCQQISADPFTRLSPITEALFRSVMAGNAHPDLLIDVHAHAFTYKNIPAKFLNYKKWLTKTVVNAALSLIRPTFLANLKLDRPDLILNNLLTIYDDAGSQPTRFSQVILCQLMMDMERAIGGGVAENFRGQMAQVVQLKNGYSFQGNQIGFDGRHHLLPFLAIDPHNPDVFEDFVSAFVPSQNFTGILALDQQAPFFGIKIYPSLGYVPNHPTLMEIFEICEQKQIPIVCHAGGYRTHPSVDEIDAAFRKQVNGQWVDQVKRLSLKGDGRNHFANFFLQPLHWENVLSAYPKLRLNLAHFGSNDDWLKYRRNEFSMVSQTINLIKKYEHVFADFSYAFYKKVNIKAIYQACKADAHLARRVLFGSDFYLCEVEHGSLSDFLENLREAFSPEPALANQIFYQNAVRFLAG